MKRKTGSSPVTDHLAALSDQVRLRILRILEKEELAVGEVAKVVQLPQSTVSRHLKVLADSGWVFKRTEGTATLYRVVMDDLPTGHRAMWVAVREMLKSDAKRTTGDTDEDLRRLASVVAERRQDAQSFFGRVAGQWDDVRTELFGSTFTLHALLHWLPREWVVADLGCGTGNVSELLAPVVKKVIAVDALEPMLSAARKRLDGLANVQFEKSTLNDLSLSTASVDAAVCVLVLHYFEDPAPALREMHRILKPGGRLLIVDMVEHGRASYRHTMGHKRLGFSEEILTTLLRQARFHNIRYSPLASDPGAKGPNLFAATAFVPEK